MKKAPVTERALEERVRRALKREGESLHKARGNATSSLGYLYIVDTSMNVVTATHQELEQLGAELGVLKPWEYLPDSASVGADQ